VQNLKRFDEQHRGAEGILHANVACHERGRESALRIALSYEARSGLFDSSALQRVEWRRRESNPMGRFSQLGDGGGLLAQGRYDHRLTVRTISSAFPPNPLECAQSVATWWQRLKSVQTKEVPRPDHDDPPSLRPRAQVIPRRHVRGVAPPDVQVRPAGSRKASAPTPQPGP
jgi:hypothetical protein